MAQPPAPDAQTFKRTGKLKLHRLSQPRHFHCVRCRQDKTASVVATMDGDQAQTICLVCYRFLQHENAKKAAKVKPRSAEAGQQSRNAKPELPSEPLRPITEKERRQLQHRLPGVDRLLVFFRAAGVRAELVRGGYLWINGSQTGPLVKTVKTPDWDYLIDEMAVKYVGDKFIRTVADNARFGEGLRAFPRRRERGFAIKRGDVRLATIYATHAQIPHREVVYANFLMPGPHWQQVADVIHSAEAERVAEWEDEQEVKAATKAAAAAAGAGLKCAAARRRIDHLPNDLAPELIEACLGASRRIRLDRQVAYERPVVLECDVGELTLLPIVRTQTRLLLPFRLIRGRDTLKGELILGGGDPLPLLIGEDVTDKNVIMAWTCALLGFADATCIDFEPAKSTVQRSPARPQRPPSSASRRGTSTPTLPRRRLWPWHLEPVGHWIHYSGSFVAGHRRRLNDGQTASDEARDRARQVGIALHPYETWVRPYARGVPDGVEMRFLWHAPTQLKGRGWGVEAIRALRDEGSVEKRQ